MRLLDLFSGIGGFPLGLERAGFTTVAFCEVEPFCQSVLRKHWPTVPIYDDVRNLTAVRLRDAGVWPVDAICGGFPCQDISVAGSGAGLLGERSGLWREFARLVGELRPRFALVENVGALRGRGLAAVLADLATLGYDAQWHVVPAAAVGAPHLRERVWIVAVASHADAGQRDYEEGSVCARRNATVVGGHEADAHAAGQRRGASRRSFGLRARDKGAQSDDVGTPGRGIAPNAPDATSPGSPQLRGLQRRLARALAAASTPWERTTEPPLRGVDDGVPSGMDGRERARRLKLIRGQDRERTKALGNAVLPLIPELIGRALLEGAAA